MHAMSDEDSASRLFPRGPEQNTMYGLMTRDSEGGGRIILHVVFVEVDRNSLCTDWSGVEFHGGMEDALS